jgi:hypothetical protein
MTMQRTIIAGASGFVLGLLVATPTADADDASYLAATSGLYHSIYDPPTMLHWGHGICDDLRGGRSFDQEVAMAPPTMAGYMDVPGVIRAAQHELCPDTLH